MNLEIMLFGVLIASAVTGLVTEAVKKLLTECGKNYHPNMLAGCCAVVVSALLSVGYAILNGIPWNGHAAVYMVTLIFLSWLCAMVGYDKVIQTITQIRKEG